MADEHRRVNILVSRSTPERVELLDKRHDWVGATNAARSVFVKLRQLAKLEELIVDERRDVPLHEMNDTPQ